MKISIDGINIIKTFEGLFLKSYLCPAKIWTIGWGSTKGVKKGMVITVQEAEQRLLDDIAPTENYLNNLGIDLNQNQFDALCSFIFNLGVGNFSSSTLLKLIKKNKNDPNIKNQFNRWVYAGGKKLPGLVKRRKIEGDLYFK